MKQTETSTHPSSPRVSATVRLTETALMIALGTVLSLVKLIDLPYGGSVTVAHMVPVILIAYRYGAKWGTFSGLTYGALQLLLGMKSLSYATSFWAGLAIVCLDYLVAYLFLAAGAWFKSAAAQPLAVPLGAFCACALRYLCHVISGATVWAGLSMPTAAALKFSLIYNATYMLPETLVTVVAAVYLSSVLDFSRERLSSRRKIAKATGFGWRALSGLFAAGTLLFAVCTVFSRLQDADAGTFSLAGLADVPWRLVGAVCLSGVVIAAILWRISYTKRISNDKNNNS